MSTVWNHFFMMRLVGVNDEPAVVKEKVPSSEPVSSSE